jgi:hypothetical protein
MSRRQSVLSCAIILLGAWVVLVPLTNHSAMTAVTILLTFVVMIPVLMAAAWLLFAVAMIVIVSWLRSSTNTVPGRTGKPDYLDTATRMAMEADFGRGDERAEARARAGGRAQPD